MRSIIKKWLVRTIYLDYASATPVLPEALQVVSDAAAAYGNPGAIHKEGTEAAKLLEQAREKIALELACKAREVVFVSGGTEANNLAILGFVRRLEINGTDLSKTHWVTSSIEHPSVLECFAEIERRGGHVSHVEPNAKGIIEPSSVARALRPETVFVSIQWVNHEIGTVQPLRDIRAVIDEHESKHSSTVIFHSDFGQGPLYLSPQVHGLGIDIASIDSGKLYGPRGVGCVYLHNRAALAPIIIGGGQERGLRAGTENVALAAGFAKAFSIISTERHSEAKRIKILRDDLAERIVAHIPGVIVNGDLKHAFPHMLNISILSISSEYVTLQLDHAGIAISTKSACREGEESRSHVVEALGDARSAASSVALAKEERAQNTLRFSLGKETAARDVRVAAETLAKIIAKTKS